MAKEGRPTLYQPEYVQRVFHLTLLGATDKEIAAAFQVNVDTIQEWKKVHPEFSDSINAGKTEADAKVAASLYKIANGYETKEVTFEKIGPGADTLEVGDEGMESIEQDTFKKKVVVKELAPNVAAINIWLKNRRGKVEAGAQKWADRVEQEITGADGKDFEITLKL